MEMVVPSAELPGIYQKLCGKHLLPWLLQRRSLVSCEVKRLSKMYYSLQQNSNNKKNNSKISVIRTYLPNP